MSEPTKQQRFLGRVYDAAEAGAHDAIERYRFEAEAEASRGLPFQLVIVFLAAALVLTIKLFVRGRSE